MSWVEEIGDLRFEYADRDIFDFEDPSERVVALQKYFFPQLARLLRGTSTLIQQVYGDDALEGMTRTERPRPKGMGFEVTEFNEVHIGLTGERHPSGLKFKKPDGAALQYGASRLWFEVHRMGTIRVVFRPILYIVDDSARRKVGKLFEETLGTLEVIASNHFLANGASLRGETLDEYPNDPGEMFTAGLYFPVGAGSGLRRLAVTFCALFPWFRAITDISTGKNDSLEKDLEAYADWWEEAGPPQLYPEFVEGLAPPRSRQNSSDAPRSKFPGLVLRDRRRWLIFQRDSWRCVSCGKSALDNVQLEIDHKKPRSQGGTDDDENLQVLCSTCNRGKSDIVEVDLTRAGRDRAP